MYYLHGYKLHLWYFLGCINSRPPSRKDKERVRSLLTSSHSKCRQISIDVLWHKELPPDQRNVIRNKKMIALDTWKIRSDYIVIPELVPACNEHLRVLWRLRYYICRGPALERFIDEIVLWRILTEIWVVSTLCLCLYPYPCISVCVMYQSRFILNSSPTN